jgi:sterol desaturase/sphingolipid hydroxylase (fatty acid hydroxylase superfamily)
VLVCHQAPSRGQHDAINVHPFEFFVGEYNHIFAVFVVSRVAPVNVFVAVGFVLIGAVLASLNHTRFDVRFPVAQFVFQSRYHDIHHWYPKANFCQYIVLWDYLFGWFLPYPQEDNKALWQNRKGAKSM